MLVTLLCSAANRQPYEMEQKGEKKGFIDSASAVAGPKSITQSGPPRTNPIDSPTV